MCQNDAMMAPMRAVHPDSPRPLDRINLRLSPEVFKKIDAARGRAGNVSRNTWVTEAIHEQLAGEAANREQQKASGE